jgi:DHA1 family tetracycline resistance protein-like MFS transporter
MFLIVLVDVLGFTIVIPLLGLYAERFGATPLIATLIVSCYAISSLISTPIIGKLSDHYGRRPLLLISQAGTCLGFIILGMSTALWMVFVGRILDGLTAGNLSLAQAYISDHTKPENRAKAFAVIGIAFGIGFMFGPLVGGVLGKYGMHYPFILAAGLSALSIFCTYTLLPKEEKKPETLPTAQVVGPGGKRPSVFEVSTYTEYFGRPALRSLYLQFFLFTYAFSAFISGFALYAERRFITSAGTAWTATEVGYLFAYSGFIGIIWQGGAIGRLVKKFGEIKLTTAAFIASFIGYAVFAFIPNDRIWPLALITIVSSFGHGVLRPVLTSRITQAVGRHEQGTAIGISGSLSSLAMMMAPPTGGFLLDHGWLAGWPMVPAVMSLLGLAVALATRGRSQSRDGASSPPPPELSSAP